MQQSKIDYIQWRDRLREFTSSDMRIGTDVILVKEGFNNLKDKPFKTDVTTCIIYLRGWVRFRINMKEFRAEAPCMIIMPYNTIIETLEVSQDVMTRVIVMSREFTDSLFAPQANVSHLHIDITANPIIDLTGEEDALIHYYSMLKNLVYRSDSPYRLNAIRHLTLALFYSYTSQKHNNASASSENRRERKHEICEQFMALLEKNYKREREVGFYAERLCLTPKYLSKTIKDTTGESVAKCIERYVITESKALLYSTDLTIQQIADSLGFESQSLFGKYFKRVVGSSPRIWRQNL